MVAAAAASQCSGRALGAVGFAAAGHVSAPTDCPTRPQPRVRQPGQPPHVHAAARLVEGVGDSPDALIELGQVVLVHALVDCAQREAGRGGGLGMPGQARTVWPATAWGARSRAGCSDVHCEGAATATGRCRGCQSCKLYQGGARARVTSFSRASIWQVGAGVMGRPWLCVPTGAGCTAHAWAASHTLAGRRGPGSAWYGGPAAPPPCQPSAQAAFASRRALPHLADQQVGQLLDVLLQLVRLPRRVGRIVCVGGGAAAERPSARRPPIPGH